MKKRPMSKLRAKKIAAGILSIEQLDVQVLCQFDANELLQKLVPDIRDRQLVIDAAEEYAQKLFEFAGDDIMRSIVGEP